jgi:hypothetical protein
LIGASRAMTVAVVDRVVHHATIFEMNVESYRRRAALERKRSRGPPAGPRDNHGQRLLSGLPRYRCRPKSGEERVQVIVDALAARLRWP